MKNILIVEDDFLNRRLIKKVLQEENYKVLEAMSADEALKVLKYEKVDLAILDIHLGKTDGISLGHLIKSQFAIPFLYLTAFETQDIVRKAIATTPMGYLTKPFKSVDLINTVELALRNSESGPSPFLIVKDEDLNVRVPLSRISFLESDGNYLLVHCEHEVYRYRSTIKQAMDTLPSIQFIQTHRAFLVNKEKISHFNSKQLMVDGKSVPVSKNFLAHVQEALN
ncbi:LytR/AlgR family response regulator transcription factor [Leadbetterella byssophila]|uniref:LytR/AlgR family response regulator transcription factor n=1 Tax=Leadbetterella byssophila TaxID=316068 RepID=UPI00399F9BD0